MDTDREVILAMLERSPLEVDSRDDGSREDWTTPGNSIRPTEPGDTWLRIEGGYQGFASVLVFDKTGALVSVEAYE